jgi:hypothetical protein
MQYKREDAREDMEGERLKRMLFLDQAGIFSVDERIESLETTDEYLMGQHLDARCAALVRAQAQTNVLLSLLDVSKNLRLTMRGLNSFLTAVMEGSIGLGQDGFSDFFISLVHDFSGIDAEYLRALELYIGLSYGDKKQQRQVPFDVAEASGVFSNDIGVMKPQLEARTRWENLTKEQMVCDERILQSLSLPHTFKGKQGTSIEPVFRGH